MSSVGFEETPVDRDKISALIEACIAVVKLLIHDVLTERTIPLDLKIAYVRAWLELQPHIEEMRQRILADNVSEQAPDEAFVAHGLTGANLDMKMQVLSAGVETASAARRRHEAEESARKDAARKSGAVFGIVNSILGSFAGAAGAGEALKEFKDAGEALLKGWRKIF